MAWPTDAVVTGDLITAAQLNGLPVRLADTTLGADGVLDFQSIPQHYAHLLVECYLRSAEAGAVVGATLRLNGDTGTQYDIQWVMGNAATASAAEGFASTQAEFGHIPASGAAANLFAAVTLEIPHYANASYGKEWSSICAHKSGTASGNLRAVAFSGGWRSTAAINQITIHSGGGADLATGSRGTIYGLP